MFMVLACCFGWALLFLLLQKFYKNDSIFNNYIVATVHAFLSCRCCEILWYIEQNMKLDQFGGDVTFAQYCVMSSTAGYLLYDTIVMLYNRDELVYVVHHILCFFMLAASIATLKCGAELIFSLWYCELSGPFLHMRFFIEQSKYKASNLAIINECIFTVIFVFCRYGLGSWTIYKLYSSQESLLIVKFACYTFFIFNQYIFYKMCMRARDVVTSARDARSKVE